MSQRIQIKTGVEADRAGATIADREPVITSDRNELFVGPTQIVLNTGETLTPSSTGTLTATIGANRREHFIIVAPTAGSGAYTAKVVLPTTTRRAWDRVTVALRLPASVNPTIQFRNASDSGTLLFTAVGNGYTRNFLLTFLYTGSAWELFAQPLGTMAAQDASAVAISGGSIEQLSLLSVAQPAAALGFGIVGDPYAGGSNDGEGVAVVLGYNGTGNRQFWIGATDALGDSAASLLRIVCAGSTVTIDAISGTGATPRRIVLGSGTALDGPLVLKSYTVATVPAAAALPGGLIHVTDEAGGATPAFSDATNWRRVADRAIVS